jgi:2-polyprenyl-3-methyl-5-hydroxy-6-metoxy-1,4-benzoquinol methylase
VHDLKHSFDFGYLQQDYFGKPYKELIDFFETYPKKGRVLDLGSGQGRDSIPLAKLGYDVTGVDLSKVGINQMLTKAKKMNLHINGIVEDIFDFKPNGKFDVILLDSILHFYKRDAEKETKFLLRIIDYLKRYGVLCIFIQRSKPNEKYLKDVLNESNVKWSTLVDKYLEFVWKDKTIRNSQEIKIKYHMLVLKRLI